MNSLLGIISEAENEKIDFFLSRFEEIKKALKLIKGYLIDFSFSGDLYGKTLLKTLKLYSPAFQTLQNDPTSLNLKINETVAIQESLCKATIAIFLDYPSFINTRMDEFHEKLNVSKKKLLDVTSMALKNYTNSKAYFYKMKLKFEKSVKECEQSVQTIKKTQVDPNTMYNQQLLAKLDQRCKGLVKETANIEVTLKNAQKEASKKLERWNKSLLEGYQILMGVYRNSFEKFIEALDKYNANYTFFLGSCLKQVKERQSPEMQNPLMLINEEDENMFLEEMKYKEPDVALLNKGLYKELNSRILNNKEPLKDQEVQLYSELAQKHLETYLILVDERRKVYKSLKNLITEISQLIDTFAKSLQKNARNNSFSSLSANNPYYKRLGLFFETFFASYDSLGKKLNNLSLFMNIKVSTLENILKEHKNYEKNLSATVSRALKDMYTTKLNLAKSIQNYDRFMASVAEAEKLKNEVKYMQNKREAEESHESSKEILALLRKLVYDGASVFGAAYKEFRNHEQLNLHSIKMIVEGISNQFLLSLDEVQDTVRFCSEFFHKRFDLDTEIKSLIALDSGLGSYDNLSSSGKIEEEDFAFDGFVVPNDYKDFMAEEKKKEKSEVESNVEDNDKMSEKSQERTTAIEDDANTPKILPHKEKEVVTNINNMMEESQEKKKEGFGDSQNHLESPKDNPEKEKEKEKESIFNVENDTVKENSSLNNIPNNFLMKETLKESGGSISRELSATKSQSMGDTQSLNPIKSVEKMQSLNSDMHGESNSEEWKSLETRFNLTAQDKLITSYACAFAQKILLQGRLYVFNTRLCFHSYFNAQTLFGHTKLNIPIDDIIKFEKRTNALIFHNAIAIITKGGELFFASFMSRDTTFDLLLKLLPLNPEAKSPPIEPILKLDYLSDSKKNELFSTDQEAPPKKESSLFSPEKKAIDEQPISDDAVALKKPHKKSSTVEQLHKLSVSLTVEPKPHQSMQFQERTLRIQALLLPIKNYKETITHNFADANLKDLFISLFSVKSDDFPSIKHKGNSYANFIELFMGENKEENGIIGYWDPIPPKYFRFCDNFDFEELLGYPDTSTFEISFHHPIKERVIFAPKFSCCTDKYKAFWISQEELVIQVDTHFAKIPFADYFIVRKGFFFKENKEKNQVELTVRYYVDFVKSTVFQSRIEKSTADESKEFYQEVFIPMALKAHKEYLHRIKERFGNESLNSRVIIKKKMRRSTKDINFLDDPPIIINPKDNLQIASNDLNPIRENVPIKEHHHHFNQPLENIPQNELKSEVRELKEEIQGLNDRLKEFIKHEEKGREEMRDMKKFMWGLLVLGLVMALKGLFN